MSISLLIPIFDNERGGVKALSRNEIHSKGSGIHCPVHDMTAWPLPLEMSRLG
jgi:hypothetical protein